MIAYIDSHRERFGVEPVCRALKFAPSTHWSAKRRAPSARARRDEVLKAEIARVHAENFGVYGAPKMWAQLNREGHRVARCTVERLMRDMGLRGAVRGRPKRTTVVDTAASRPRDLVERRFSAPTPNRLWVADLTYVRTWSGFCYVSFVADAYSRRIVGCRRRGRCAATWPSTRSSRPSGSGTATAPASAGWSTTPTAARKPNSIGRRNTLMIGGVCCGDDEGVPAGGSVVWGGQVLSLGRSMVAWRQDRVEFWAAIARGDKTDVASAASFRPRRMPAAAIARGDKTDVASAAAGVSSGVGYRWFRHAGGVNPCFSSTVSARYLSFLEREDIALFRAQGAGVRGIARRLGRSPSTISRELRRNASTRTWRLERKATTAQWHVERRARRPKPAKLAVNGQLRGYVQDRLAGRVRAPDGRVLGPEGPEWNGKNKPHRGDRRRVQAWSPEQISNRLKVDFPDDESMRTSCEAIYQALCVESRGARRRELVSCLRSGRALRVPRARARRKACAHVTPEVMINQRPPEAGDSYDNALAESIIGLYKTGLVRNKGPWRGLDDLELATLEWVDWFNHRRLFHDIGRIPPAEAEELHYRQQHLGPQANTQTKQPA